MPLPRGHEGVFQRPGRREAGAGRDLGQIRGAVGGQEVAREAEPVAPEHRRRALAAPLEQAFQPTAADADARGDIEDRQVRAGGLGLEDRPGPRVEPDVVIRRAGVPIGQGAGLRPDGRDQRLQRSGHRRGRADYPPPPPPPVADRVPGRVR